MSGAMGVRRRAFPTCLRAGGALCALLSLADGVAAQMTPAGAVIRNWAELQYQLPNGRTYTVSSDTTAVVVGQVAGVDVEPPLWRAAPPGTRVIFPHTIRNIGNGADAFVLAAVSRAGWATSLYADVDGDGWLSGADAAVSGPVALSAGQSMAFLVAVDVPGGNWAGRGADTVEVSGRSQFDSRVADVVEDVLGSAGGGGGGGQPVLIKSVDRLSASPGDVLTYTLSFTAGESVAGVEIVDPVPAGTLFMPGTIQVDGIAADPSVGFHDPTLDRVVVRLGAVAAGQRRTLTFQVRVRS